MAINTFKRNELKFLLNDRQYNALMPKILEYMNYDKFCVGGKEYGIYNIYYDTPDDYLIRESLSKPYYKEKIRLRSYYSPAKPDDTVFLEIKKKIGGIVAKRRVTMTLSEAENYIAFRKKPIKEKFIHEQVLSELDVAFNTYPELSPKQYISYQRLAFFGKEDSDFRLTFDRVLTERRYDLSLSRESYGNQILLPDQHLMEVKILGAMPLWLAHALSELEIFKISFSKYGKAYKKFASENKDIYIGSSQIVKNDNKSIVRRVGNFG